jgi:DNA adenine methylase
MIKTNDTRSHTGKIRPFLRWAGSKKQLLPALSQYWNVGFDRYIEPFAGSSRLFFETKPHKATLGDINRELIHTYMEVKHRLPSVLRSLGQLRKSKRRYNYLREQDPRKLTNTQRASRFIYLNRFCFNGLYRTNKNGEFNVPYGRKTGKLPSKEELLNCSKSLRAARLSVGDFGQTLAHASPGDFVYMDPPFHANGRRIFKEYTGTGFGESDLVRLRDWMVKLDIMGAKFLVSYAKCPEAGVLTEGFHVKTVAVKRSIAGFGANRRRSYELLISNFKPKPVRRKPVINARSNNKVPS